MESKVVLDPYEAVVPYSTCESVAWSVVHDTVIPLVVAALVDTPLITGAGGGVVRVVNVESVLDVSWPAEFVLSTR